MSDTSEIKPTKLRKNLAARGFPVIYTHYKKEIGHSVEAMLHHKLFLYSQSPWKALIYLNLVIIRSLKFKK